MNFFGLLFKTSTDFSFYRRLCGNSRMQALRFVAVLTLLSTLFVSAKFTTSFTAAASEYTKWFGYCFNGMKITNGQLDWDSRLVENFGGSSVMFTINTKDENAATSYVVPENTSLGVLLAKDKMVIKKAGTVASEIQEISLEPIADFEVTPDSMKKINTEAAVLFGLLCSVSVFLLVFASRMLRAFIIGQLTYFIIFSANKNTLNTVQRQNICLYALGPSTVLEILGLAFFPGNPYILSLSLGLYLAFLMGAFSNIRRNNAQLQKA